MKKSLIILLLYLLVFTTIFGVAVYNYSIQREFFEVGFPGQTTNIIIILLSTGSIMKTVYHIISF